MNKVTLNKFKKLFEEQKKNLLFHDKVVRDDFSVSTEELFDEVDHASHDIEQSMRMRLRNRELLYLKKIDEALERIEDGTFGECEDCGCEIEHKRLLARPTATLCVSCKEEQERKEGMSASVFQHKSLGASFTRQI